MPIIHATETHKAKTTRRCENCRIQMVGGHQWRLYGHSGNGEKPYVVWICPRCADNDSAVKHYRERKAGKGET